MHAKPSIQSLEFLRGVAAVYVLLNHCRGKFFVGGQKMIAMGHASLPDYAAIAALRATSLGAEFVILFFVISGYSMAHSISSASNIGSFYLKRVIRIWPPYIAAVALVVVAAWVFSVEDVTRPERIVQLVFYTNVNTPLTPQFWSLPYEVLFYAICPIVLLTRGRTMAFLVTSVISAAVFVLVKGPYLNPAAYLWLNFLGNEALFFAFGACLYHAIERVPAVGPKTLAAVTVTALMGVSAINLVVFADQPNMPMAIIMLLLSALVLRNLPELPAWARPLNVGRFSYSIYIFHYALVFSLYEVAYQLLGIRQSEMTSYWMWMLTVPPIMVACYVLYLFTERPCNEAVGRIRRAGGARAGGAGA